MAKFDITIKAQIEARNIESAQKKIVALKDRIAGNVEWSELWVRGVVKKGEGE